MKSEKGEYPLADHILLGTTKEEIKELYCKLTVKEYDVMVAEIIKNRLKDLIKNISYSDLSKLAYLQKALEYRKQRLRLYSD